MSKAWFIEKGTGEKHLAEIGNIVPGKGDTVIWRCKFSSAKRFIVESVKIKYKDKFDWKAYISMRADEVELFSRDGHHYWAYLPPKGNVYNIYGKKDFVLIAESYG
jgi:hypothetical protein